MDLVGTAIDAFRGPSAGRKLPNRRQFSARRQPKLQIKTTDWGTDFVLVPIVLRLVNDHK